MALIDAQALKVLYPSDYYAPTKEELEQLSAGSLVKVSNIIERFWVFVESVHPNGAVIGRIGSNLSDTSFGYDYGAYISFHKKKICDIYWKMEEFLM